MDGWRERLSIELDYPWAPATEVEKQGLALLDDLENDVRSPLIGVMIPIEGEGNLVGDPPETVSTSPSFFPGEIWFD